ncbi:MAG TPA: glycosyltransferase family 4 protein [Thermoleophilaceae bacterium]|nr:glycosyltransferase family 4 protein [Thermoleophilaceae bacterium]
MTDPRVLVVHNRYRIHGGEERAVDLQVAALRRAGIAYDTFFRDSAEAGKLRAARSLVHGGEAPDELVAAIRRSDAQIVHFHNMHPLLGARALEAAKQTGAQVVMHLHNFRLFCAIGVCFRMGEPCFRCHGRWTLPGVALNCRGSVPEAVAYGYALAEHQPKVFANVDRFVTPSTYAARQLEKLGLPEGRAEILPHYIPPAAVTDRSLAARGEFALAFGRLSAEKGFDVAVDAAAIAGVPLKITGEGPLERDLAQRIEREKAPVELCGKVPADRLRDLLRRAAMVVVPTKGNETFGFAALEAMAAGVPVIAARAGALPEIVGDAACVARGDALAVAARMRELWEDPQRRADQGAAAIARARDQFGEERYVRSLLALYADVLSAG